LDFEIKSEVVVDNYDIIKQQQSNNNGNSSGANHERGGSSGGLGHNSQLVNFGSGFASQQGVISLNNVGHSMYKNKNSQ
jgi:hypothetical protein